MASGEPRELEARVRRFDERTAGSSFDPAR